MCHSCRLGHVNDFPHASQMNYVTRVRFFVAFEARGLGECLSTSCTMERLHTRMLSVMYNQVTGYEKCLYTCCTHERHHTRVYTFVQFEISEIFESLSTCFTHEFHTRIPSSMLIETARGGKCFSTCCTCVWFNTSVSSFVHFEIPGSNERLFTGCANERSQTYVCFVVMHCETILPGSRIRVFGISCSAAVLSCPKRIQRFAVVSFAMNFQNVIMI